MLNSMVYRIDTAESSVQRTLTNRTLVSVLYQVYTYTSRTYPLLE